jgi:hypothetical protein
MRGRRGTQGVWSALRQPRSSDLAVPPPLMHLVDRRQPLDAQYAAELRRGLELLRLGAVREQVRQARKHNNAGRGSAHACRSKAGRLAAAAAAAAADAADVADANAAEAAAATAAAAAAGRERKEHGAAAERACVHE